MLLRVSKAGPLHEAYCQSLDWWRAVLQSGVSVPLAPQLRFPACEAPGCIFAFTDAARESGTGYGGFTVVRRGSEQVGELLFMAQEWPEDTLLALQSNALSMPAGEMFGAVVLLDAVISRLGRVTHAICFTDSVATASGLTTAASHAPQLNTMLSWLFNRNRQVQFLGVHQKGLRNQASDRLSRGKGAAVLVEAAQSGLRVEQLHPHSSAARMLEEARRQPTREQRPEAARARRRQPEGRSTVGAPRPSRSAPAYSLRA